MATREELPQGVRTFMEMYAWKRNEPVPWAPVRKPLPQCKVGLVVMACMTMPDQPPFHTDEPDFDPSIRIVPSETDPSILVNTYPGQAFDHTGLQTDANLLIPLDRLRDMREAGEIGGIAPRTVSLCGHLPKTGGLVEETAPQIARIFTEDEADVVLLVPA